MLQHLGSNWGDALWIAIGFAGQGLFTARMLVQWVASEKNRESVVPLAFWWLSLVGGLTLLAYSLHKRDPVIFAGQSTGVLVYIRNLMIIYGKRDSDPSAVPSPKLRDRRPESAHR